MIEPLPETSRALGPRRPDPDSDPVGRALGSIVAAAFRLGLEDVRSSRRGPAEISFARQVAMYLAHTRLGLSFAATGRSKFCSMAA